MTESIPYDLKYFLQDIGIIEVLQVVETQGTDQTKTYNILQRLQYHSYQMQDSMTVAIQESEQFLAP